MKRQPCSPYEIDKTVEAMWSSEADCIRYRGDDAALLERLARAGMSDQADFPLRLDVPAVLRDRVTFGIEAQTRLPTSASLIAAAFRTDMRTRGDTVLPALFGRNTVRVSWYQNRFHVVQFINEGDGRFGARLRSRNALQGLAWKVDEWLRARNAESIYWEAAGDPTSSSRTPM